MATAIPKPIIAVIGGNDSSADLLRDAGTVGRGIAERGAVLICGGRGGIMEAACRGAVEAGGETIGVLPGADAQSANPWVTIPLVTNMGSARNLIIVQSAAAIIAIDGRYGTLSELAFALDFGVPVVGLRTWEVDPAIIAVNTAEEAVTRAFECIARNR